MVGRGGWVMGRGGNDTIDGSSVTRAPLVSEPGSNIIGGDGDDSCRYDKTRKTTGTVDCETTP